MAPDPTCALTHKHTQTHTHTSQTLSKQKLTGKWVFLREKLTPSSLIQSLFKHHPDQQFYFNVRFN